VFLFYFSFKKKKKFIYIYIRICICIPHIRYAMIFHIHEKNSHLKTLAEKLASLKSEKFVRFALSIYSNNSPCRVPSFCSWTVNLSLFKSQYSYTVLLWCDIISDHNCLATLQCRNGWPRVSKIFISHVT
jgi:hypothetical protein